MNIVRRPPSLPLSIGTVIDLYRMPDEALALQEKVLGMTKPEQGSLKAAKLWFDGKSEGLNGRHAPSFSGLGATRLDDENDLVAVHLPFEKDWLVKFVSLPYLRLLCLASWFHSPSYHMLT